MNESCYSPGGIATLACLLEVSAPKPGNVHRAADFEDVTFDDFAVSAVALGQAIDAGLKQSTGQVVLDAVERTIQAVGTNTNLGICLGIVPLAKMVIENRNVTLNQTRVTEFLARLDGDDGAKIFQAIRLANPGGLGESNEQDVRTTTNDRVDLLAAMRSAADRDAIARQYASGFRDVFEFGVPALVRGVAMFGKLSHAIVYAHVAWMANSPDTLIARKCGVETANHSQFLAAKTLACFETPICESGPALRSDIQDLFWMGVGELDFWLRSDGHQRNPGTTADLIAASLFVAIQNKSILPPYR